MRDLGDGVERLVRSRIIKICFAVPGISLAGTNSDFLSERRNMAGEPKYTIGREKTCSVPIADDSVSRLHAEISLSDRGQIVLTDLRSANGTTILRGGVLIEVRTEIMQPSDEIRFGDVMLSAQDVIETIERKAPGALSVRRPPPPPPAMRAASPPVAPASIAGPPNFASPAPSAGRVVRCECGAVRTIGVPCPGCHR